MSNLLTKINQRIATKSLNHHDLSCNHITSSDFFALRPVYIHEMMPKEKINIKMSTFARLDPLFKPVFGSCKFVNRAFFVPMRLIQKNWNEFITQSVVNDGNTPWVPREVAYFTLQQWFAFICKKNGNDYVYVTKKTSVSTGEHYDFYISTAFGSVEVGYYTYNPYGRRIITIMHSLGYSFDTLYAPNSETLHISALPLFAFYKLWIDWYSSSQYIQTTTFENLFSNMGNNIGASGLSIIFERLFGIEYEKDYFTSAWNNPVGPNNANAFGNVINLSTDPTLSTANGYVSNETSQMDVTDDNTPYIRKGNGDFAEFTLSQYFVDALKAATDYVKRKQLAGVRAMDRYLAQWGIRLSDEKLKRSVYLGKHEVNVEIADVMNTTAYSDPTSPALGDYSGKGISFGNGNISYRTDEAGYLVILSVLLPHVGYYDGLLRQNMHTKPLDFFTPEFDRLGTQPIAALELKTLDRQDSLAWGAAAGFTADDVFGFTSRYAEYKCSRDFMSGNMRLYPEQYDVFHFMRKIGNTDHSISQNFLTRDQSQFNRVFADTTNNLDHLQTVYRFKVDSYSPASKMFDDYEFDGGNTTQINVDGTRFD